VLEQQKKWFWRRSSRGINNKVEEDKSKEEGEGAQVLFQDLE
jgi:hypothetical protein